MMRMDCLKLEPSLEEGCGNHVCEQVLNSGLRQGPDSAQPGIPMLPVRADTLWPEEAGFIRALCAGLPTAVYRCHVMLFTQEP